jgi:hypothetical protein
MEGQDAGFTGSQSNKRQLLARISHLRRFKARIESNSVFCHTLLDQRRIEQQKQKTPPSSAKLLPTVDNNLFNGGGPSDYFRP